MSVNAIYQQLVRTECLVSKMKKRDGVAATDEYFQRNHSRTQSFDISNEAKHTATPHH